MEFTFQMIMDNNGAIAQELNTSVAEMSCPDENTFVMVLNAPTRPSWARWPGIPTSSSPSTSMRCGGLKTCAAATTNPIGTGTYKFVSYDRGVSVVLEKNPDYHMGEPDVERLIFQVIPDSDTALQASSTARWTCSRACPTPRCPPCCRTPSTSRATQRRAPLPDRRQYAE